MILLFCQRLQNPEQSKPLLDYFSDKNVPGIRAVANFDRPRSLVPLPK